MGKKIIIGNKEVGRLQVIYSFIDGYVPGLRFRGARDEHYFELETQQDKMERILLHADNMLGFYVDWINMHILYLAIEAKIGNPYDAEKMYGNLGIDEENEREKRALFLRLWETNKLDNCFSASYGARYLKTNNRVHCPKTDDEDGYG